MTGATRLRAVSFFNKTRSHDDRGHVAPTENRLLAPRSASDPISPSVFACSARRLPAQNKLIKKKCLMKAANFPTTQSTCPVSVFLFFFFKASSELPYPRVRKWLRQDTRLEITRAVWRRRSCSLTSAKSSDSSGTAGAVVAIKINLPKFFERMPPRFLEWLKGPVCEIWPVFIGKSLIYCLEIY